MFKRHFPLPLLFFLLGVGTRFPLIEKIQSHWDGPQYSIAVVRYSLEQETPAPPGYPLYIALGRFFYIFTHDPYYSILLVSVLGAGMGAMVFYIVGERIFNRKVGIVASCLFLTGSSFYYFGLTPYAYGVTPTLAALLAVIVYEVVFKKKNLKTYRIYASLLGGFFAVAVGFRPQELIFIMPLFLFGIYHLPIKSKIISVLCFLLCSIAWLIPFLIITGGLTHYIQVSSHFAQSGAIKGVSFFYSFNYMIFFLVLVRGFFLTFGIASVFLIFYLFSLKHIKKYSKKILFFIVWITPCLSFNLFVRSEHAGYQMVYLSAFLLLISYAMVRICKTKLLLVTTLLICIIFNLYWFFHNRDPHFKLPYSQTSFHYSEIQKNDLLLGEKITYIKKHYDSNSTLLLTSMPMWRPIMYYFPNSYVLEIDRLDIVDKNFKDYIRLSKNWNFTLNKNTSNTVTIPKGVLILILMDDTAKNWALPKHTIQKLSQHNSIIIIPTNNASKIEYGYHSIKLK